MKIITIKAIYETSTKLGTAEEYFYSAYDKANQNDYSGAISDYTKAIELDPNYANAYYQQRYFKT